MADNEHGSHPGVGEYVEIGVFLAGLTAVEVALFFSNIPSAVTVPSLLFLTALKFALVILWFMHLRFDHKLFRRLLFVGIGLAATVYTVVWLTFR